MTFAQYQQWQATAQSRIQQRLAELEPRGGNGCTVLGNSIALEPPRRVAQERAPETWIVGIFITVESLSLPDGEGHTTPRALAGFVTRLQNEIVPGFAQNTYYWQDTQFFRFPHEDYTNERRVSVKLEVGTFEPVYPPGRDTYRFPVEVTLDYYAPRTDTVHKQVTLRVGRGGVVISPVPPNDTDGFQLQLSGIHRI